MLSKTFTRTVLAAAVMGSATLTYAGPAPEFAYLDDALARSEAPDNPGPFPKIMLTETRSLEGPAERFTKYDLIGTKAGMASKVASIQDRNPDVRFHYGFSPRAYQGYILKDPCQLSMGLPFGETRSVTQGCSIFAGHFMYYAGSKAASGFSASATTVKVNDPDRFQAGQYVVIYDAPAGSFKNAEHAKVVGVSKSAGQIFLAKRGYKSTALARSAGAIIAQHVMGRGNSELNWAYNVSLASPRDANNNTTAEVMADWLEANVTKKGTGEDSGVNLDGIYFDADRYFIDMTNVDVDNDLFADEGVSNDGVNLWGEGLEDLYSRVRERFPNRHLVGGERLTRGFDLLNGTQMENFPAAGGSDHVAPNYGHVNGFDGYDSMLQRYMIQLQHRTTEQGYVENLSKAPSKLYPYGKVKPSTNAPIRFALGSTLLGNGYFGQQNSKEHPDPWYDEYAVDVKPGSPTYGHAMKSNPNDESKILAAKGWLGAPVGRYERLFDEQVFAPNRSLLNNGGFENNIVGWQVKNLKTKVESTGALEGGKVLYLPGHQAANTQVSGAQLKGERVQLQAGKEYTLAFAAKAKYLREISVRVQGAKSLFLVPSEWTRILYTFKADRSGTFRPIFLLGREDVPMWLDAVYLFEGNANVFLREFENGIVVVNGTPSSRTVDLGGTFLRTKGTGQDPVNNGAEVSVVTLPPYDAAILVRREGEAVIAGEDGDDTDTDSGNGNGDGNGQGGGNTGSCGAPEMTPNADRTVYVWEDSCSPGRWHLRTKANNGVQTFSGRLEGDGFTQVKGFRLENGDVLNTGDPKQIVFGLGVGGSGTDGIDFGSAASGGMCLKLEQAGQTQVRLGASATPVEAPVDIRTGKSCAPRASLGQPDYLKNGSRGTYVWEDSNTGAWHVRVFGGGIAAPATFEGKATGAGILNLEPYRLESYDSLKKTDLVVSYSARVSGKGEDGFSFKLAPGSAVCLDAGSPAGPVFLGAGTVKLTAPLNLATLGSCDP